MLCLMCAAPARDGADFCGTHLPLAQERVREIEQTARRLLVLLGTTPYVLTEPGPVDYLRSLTRLGA